MTRTALVTGGTVGIGYAFARDLASAGYNLVLVARNRERLEAVKTELEDRFSVSVDVVDADLGTAEGLSKVVDKIESSEIDFLINNAGFGSGKKFIEMTGEEHDAMLRVNVNALVQLSHAALRQMISRNSGDLINVGSVAGFVPGLRSSSTYAATKAFVIAFTEGLMPVTSGTNIHASVLCPGFVHTEFHKRAGIKGGKISPLLWLSADRVVTEALCDHRKGRVLSIPSLRYKLIVAIARIAPRYFLLKLMSRMGKL